jgi:intracellular septation protein A
MMQRLKKLVLGAFGTFGPLIIFVAAEHLLSLRWAIGLSTSYTLAEIAWRMWRREKLSQLFIFTAAMTLGFGGIDLVLNQPVFLKYEAVATNVLTGVYFAASVFGGKSLIEAAYAQAPREDKPPLDPELRAFFRLLTMIWAIYFFVKSVAYFFVARAYDYDHALAIRTVAGNVSMFALLGISLVGGRTLLKLVQRVGLFRVEPEPQPNAQS